MGFKERVKRLEKSDVHKGHEVLVRYVFPDDWEGEIPPGGYRASEIPPVPAYVKYYVLNDYVLCLPEVSNPVLTKHYQSLIQ